MDWEPKQQRIERASFGRVLALAVLTTLGAAPIGCSKAKPNPIDPPPPVMPSIKAAADDPAGLDGAGQSSFPMANTRSIQLRLQTPELPSSSSVSWVTLRIFNPYGGLYHTRHIPYSTDPEIKTIQSPDGVPHPIDVVQATAIPGGYGLDTQVLVGGTNIVRHPNPGMWKVTMELDERPDISAEGILELRGAR